MQLTDEFLVMQSFCRHMKFSNAQPSLTLFPSRVPGESLAALRSLIIRIPFLAVNERTTG